MFFFIQFLVVTVIMAAALLLAQPEVPVFPLRSDLEALGRGCGFVIHLPARVLRSIRTPDALQALA